MPLPDAPRTKDPHLLDIVAALPENVYGFVITVSLGRSDQRVHVRIDAVFPTGEALLGTMRCGVRTWRCLLLPSVLAFARVRRIDCTVREVENGPPVRSVRIVPDDSLPDIGDTDV